jgi:hypothetical protein
MWIFTVLPEWVFHLFFGISFLGVIVGFFLSMIPVIKKYSIPIKIISIFMLALSLYLQGGLADFKEWQLKVKELEARIAVAEEQAKSKNTEIQEKVVTQTQVIREKGKDIVRYIDREVVKVEEVIKYIEHCPVPQEIIDIHNQAAKLNEAAKNKKDEKK